MDKPTEVVRYTYRLRPGATAERALMDEWHRCRYLWNEAVHQFKTGRKPTFCKLSKMLTAARGANAWLREGSQMVQQQVLRSFAQSLTHSFTVRGRGRPKVKKRRGSLPSLGYVKVRITDGRLILPKGVVIPVVWSRPLPSEPTSVRVFRDNLGHWYASFVVRREVEPVADVDGALGIDWGVSTTATTTDPAYDLPHVGARAQAASDMKAAQRKMSRRRKPSGQSQTKGYKRAKLEAAKVAKKARRRNAHAGRVWARRVIAGHQLIAVEDFRPKFLAKSTMAKKAADAAIGTIKRTLIEYAERAGRKVVLVQPAYTTMTCSGCFARAKRLMLDERTFACPSCGLIEERDRNAAKTILAVAEQGHTSVDDVRHAEAPLSVGGFRVQAEVEIPPLKAGNC